MVKVRNPLNSEGASGRLGNQVVFKPRAQQQTAARHAAQRNPSTTRQQTVRAVFAQTARAWSALSSAQRDAWQDYAQAHPVPGKFGEIVKLPAFDMYCRCSRAFVEQFGGAPGLPQPQLHGLQISNLTVASPVPGRVDLGVNLPAGCPAFSLIAWWYQGPLANKLRKLRVPEQRFIQFTVTPANTCQLLGQPSGTYFWYGAQLCIAGVIPAPMLWTDQSLPVT